MTAPQFFTMIPQLRITVNSRCQKACFYCRPAGEGSVQFPSYEMSTNEIVEVVRFLAQYGITDVKLTGGDPALRDDIVALVRGIRDITAIRSIHLVTRHPRAGILARELADAGLDCINFSLDTLDPKKFRLISGVGGHAALIEAVKAAVPVSRSVKINTVVMAGINDDELLPLVEFCESVGVDTLKFLDLILDMDPRGESFVHRLDKIVPGRGFEDLYLPLDNLANNLASMAETSSVSRQPGGLGHPMMTFDLPSGLVVQLKDARRGAWYSDVCLGCPLFPCHDAIMALRLTTEGKLQRCLAREDNLLDILTPIKNADLGQADNITRQALYTFANATFSENPNIRASTLYPVHADSV